MAYTLFQVTDALEQAGEGNGKRFFNLGQTGYSCTRSSDGNFRFLVAAATSALAQAVTTSHMQDGKQLLELIYIYIYKYKRYNQYDT